MGRDADAAVAEMEPGAARPRGQGAQVHPAAHGGGVVPLVPRHGGHDLSRSRHPGGDPRQVHPGAGRPGRRSRAQLPLRGLGLARDHHARQGRQRDLQAPRLHPARAVRQAAGRGHRGSLGAAVLHDGRDGRSQRRRPVRRAAGEDRGARAQDLRPAARRLRRDPALPPWRHAGMGAGAQPAVAAQRRRRDLARRRRAHAGRRAADHRSGVGRHVPVFRQGSTGRARTSRSC